MFSHWLHISFRRFLVASHLRFSGGRSWRSTATDKSSSRCLRGAAMDGTMCISSTKRRGIIAICLGCFLPDDLPSTKHGNPCCFHIGYDLLSWTLPVTVPRHQQCKSNKDGALERKITYCILIYKYLWIFQLATFDYQRRHT